MTKKQREQLYKYNLYVKHQESKEWGLDMMTNSVETIIARMEYTERFGNVDYKLIYKADVKKSL